MCVYLMVLRVHLSVVLVVFNSKQKRRNNKSSTHKLSDLKWHEREKKRNEERTFKAKGILYLRKIHYIRMSMINLPKHYHRVWICSWNFPLGYQFISVSNVLLCSVQFCSVLFNSVLFCSMEKKEEKITQMEYNVFVM